MIQQVRKRFFRISMLALTAAMLLVTAAANLANWINVRMELEETLRSIASAEHSGDHRGLFRGRSRHMKGVLSEARFFTVTVEEDGTLCVSNPHGEQELEAADMEFLAQKALNSGREEGFVEEYLFTTITDGDEVRLVFLNSETRLNGVFRLLAFSVGACGLGIALAWVFTAKASRRAIRPIEENMRRQKRFITDASHELKTPLTVISANMDVLDMDEPDNPWVQSTKKQVSQMSRLVEDLVYLSRMEEADTTLSLETVALKPLMEEVSEPFSAMSELNGQRLCLSVPEGLVLDCNPESVSRLLHILCDNAVKYAPEEDEILLFAENSGKTVTIGTENALTEPLAEEECTHLFDRFYRADPSRSKEQRGGFGIGLATAASIAERHGGSSEAALTPEGRLRIWFHFPQKHN